MRRQIPREQAGFRQGRGTRDHIANIRWIIELARERRKSVYFAFIDYTKAFDSVDHELLWSLNNMGAPRHTISLLKNLYANQEAQVRLELGETKWFPISKGARQGCILSPSLFNLYAEMIIRNALGDNETGVKIGGQTISNLRYADDTTILAETSADLKHLLEVLESEGNRAGLRLNASKTKIMSTDQLFSSTFSVGNNVIEIVDSFNFLGSIISKDGSCIHEVKRRIGCGKSSMKRLARV